ncbi:MAG: ACT domain-containing protein [Clostridium perfringens]|nr:ACT domain-containing protein [Clostridium perfringens]
MSENLLIIDKKVLPEVFEKVINVKKILKEGKVKEVTEATKIVGISRSVYYKYKDFVFEFSDMASSGTKVVFNMSVAHQKGVLSSILSFLSEAGGNILIINQGIPINGVAHVTITMDISVMEDNFNNVLEKTKEIYGVKGVELIAMEK